MKALTWHGKRDVRVDDVPDPKLEQPTDAIIRVTSTGLCGSDLHLYEVLGPFIGEGDVLGHEPMGVVEEVGSDVTNLSPGDRVVVPFNISCGHCWMCTHGLQSQCETTQGHEQGTGAALLGYTKLYGRCRAARRSTSGCRRRSTDRSWCPRARPTSASSSCPTCCRRHGKPSSTRRSPTAGRSRCSVSDPIGQMAARIARHRGAGRRLRHRSRRRAPRHGPASRRRDHRPPRVRRPRRRAARLAPAAAGPTP